MSRSAVLVWDRVTERVAWRGVARCGAVVCVGVVFVLLEARERGRKLRAQSAKPVPRTGRGGAESNGGRGRGQGA